MVIGPAGSGKTTLLREGFRPTLFMPRRAHAAQNNACTLTPHVGKQAVIFDIDGTLCAPADAGYPASPSVGTCPRLAERKARAPAAEWDYSDTRFTRSAYLPQTNAAASICYRRCAAALQDIRQHLHCQLPVLRGTLPGLIYCRVLPPCFQSLNRQDRDAILGVTFTRRAHENDDWRTELNAFWQTWVDRMNLALPDPMVASRLTPARLYSVFPARCRGSREPLVSPLEGLL